MPVLASERDDAQSTLQPGPHSRRVVTRSQVSWCSRTQSPRLSRMMAPLPPPANTLLPGVTQVTSQAQGQRPGLCLDKATCWATPRPREPGPLVCSRGETHPGPVRKSGEMRGLEWAPREAVGVPGFGGRRLGLPASHLPDGRMGGDAGLPGTSLPCGGLASWAGVHVGAIPTPRLCCSAGPACLPTSWLQPRRRGLSAATSGSSAAPASAPSGRPPALGAALSFRREKTPSPAPGCLPEAFPALQGFGGRGSPRGACAHQGSLRLWGEDAFAGLGGHLFCKSWPGPGARHEEPWMGAARLQPVTRVPVPAVMSPTGDVPGLGGRPAGLRAGAT